MNWKSFGVAVVAAILVVAVVFRFPAIGSFVTGGPKAE